MEATAQEYAAAPRMIHSVSQLVVGNGAKLKAAIIGGVLPRLARGSAILHSLRIQVARSEPRQRRRPPGGGVTAVGNTFYGYAHLAILFCQSSRSAECTDLRCGEPRKLNRLK